MADYIQPESEAVQVARLLRIRESFDLLALRGADTIDRQRKEFDANVDRLKACEHVADGDDGWERLRNECPSTAAVARLRDEHDRQREEIVRLRETLHAFLTWFDKQNDDMEGIHYLNGDSDKYAGNGHDDVKKVGALARSALSDTTRGK